MATAASDDVEEMEARDVNEDNGSDSGKPVESG